MTRLRIWIVTLFLFVALAPGARSEDSPKMVTEGFQAVLLSVMQQSLELDVSERFDLIRPAIAEAFNLPIMVSIASAPYWSEASDDRKRALIVAFHRMSAARVATLFDGYSGEKFEITGERDGPHGTRLIDTRLVSPSGDSHKISYVAKKTDQEWRLVDVVVDGKISELSVSRSEYQAVLKNDGIDGLIRLLETKAAELLGR